MGRGTLRPFWAVRQLGRRASPAGERQSVRRPFETMKKPLSIWTVIVISSLRCFRSVAILLYLISIVGTELSPFDEGFVSGVGFDPELFGTDEVWIFLRRFTLTTVLSALTVAFVWNGKRRASLITLGLMLIFSLPTVEGLLLGLFLPSAGS